MSFKDSRFSLRSHISSFFVQYENLLTFASIGWLLFDKKNEGGGGGGGGDQQGEFLEVCGNSDGIMRTCRNGLQAV